MNHEDFNELVDKLEATRVATLKTKNARYAPGNDALHNFHIGADIMGASTAQCIWGYATKHIVALRDKILRNDFSDLEDTLEKIQDIQNYLTFIWCAANEELTESRDENDGYCHDCHYNCEIEKRDCECCAYDGKGGFDDESGKCTMEPCKSCRLNFLASEPEYTTAPLNWVARPGLDEEENW